MDKVVARCRQECTLALLDRFLTNLASDLSASDVASDKVQSARVLMWWSEAKRNLSGATSAILTYIDEYRATYRGRGLPVEYDTTIGQRAMNIGMSMPMGGFDSKTSGHGGSSTSSGSQLSYPSQSPSESAANAAALEQMKEITAAMRSMQSSIISLSSKVERMEGWKSDAHITCSKCGEVGHRAKNCPEKRKNKKTKEEKEEEE